MKDNILSFRLNPKYLDIIDKIRHFQADGPFKSQSPRIMAPMSIFYSPFQDSSFIPTKKLSFEQRGFK